MLDPCPKNRSPTFEATSQHTYGVTSKLDYGGKFAWGVTVFIFASASSGLVMHPYLQKHPHAS